MPNGCLEVEADFRGRAAPLTDYEAGFITPTQMYSPTCLHCCCLTWSRSYFALSLPLCAFLC